MYLIRSVSCLALFALILQAPVELSFADAAAEDAKAVVLKPITPPPSEPMPKGSFYKKPSIFSLRPKDDVKYVQHISRFGPVGIGIELHPPAFVMKVGSVEEGSPAAATGKIRKGQIIERINGEALKDIDPRIQLGMIIEKAEATDGVVELVLKNDGSAESFKVKVKIPVLGAYSDSWPLDCAKSDAIVRNLAKYLAKNQWGGEVSMDGPRMLFLLSTGNEQDLAVATEWAKKTIAKYEGKTPNLYQWFISWGGPALAEYYLRTGDEEMLPILEAVADSARRNMYHDGWGGRGMAGHHMGLAGTGTLTFLLLARQCGIDVDEDMLQVALRHYYRFAGKGTNPYMDARPEPTFTDNGRNGRLAFAMNAAVALIPDGEDSLYAQARDISAIKSYYSTSYMLHGHTGGGIGEVWRSAAMGLIFENQNDHYRDFMNERKWFYEISRRFDGSFGIVDGERYDNERYGIALGLTYTVPRKNLCIFGAPRSKYAKFYKIPDRPWGRPADDMFLSLESIPDANGVKLTYDNERLETHAAIILHRALDKPQVDDSFILEYARHREHGYRQAAAEAIVRHGRYHLLPRLLKDRDPRVRQAGLMAIPLPRVKRGEWIQGLSAEHFTDEIQSLILAMINDPDESLFVVDRALAAAAMCPPGKLAPHVDTLTALLNHDEWWIRESALKVLLVLLPEKQHTGNVMDAVSDVVLRKVIRSGVINSMSRLPELLANADKDQLKQVVGKLSAIYLDYSVEAIDPPGGLHPASEEWMLNKIAAVLGELPGGREALYAAASKRYPDKSLPHQNVFLSGDLTSVSGPVKAAVTRIVKETLVPQHMVSNWEPLKAAFESQPKRMSERALKELHWLYNRAGISEYNWRPFGPVRNKMEWYYYSFDAPEKWMKEDDRMGRFREVTFPAEVEEWYKDGFDPKAAGWKSGKAPFGAADGEPYHHARENKDDESGCKDATGFCGCGEPVNTLWENEVLLLRGRFKIPSFEDGYCYRLLHGGISHVGFGGGYKVYINGKLFIDNQRGVDRRAGGVAIGKIIPRDWWEEFSGKEVELSVVTFKKRCRGHGKYGGYITLFLQRMKPPQMDASTVEQAAVDLPLKTSQWQSLQDPDITTGEHEGKFIYDGKFEKNPDVLGEWTVLGVTDSPETFSGKKSLLKNVKTPLKSIAFKAGGKTGDMFKRYTGSILMDIGDHQALAMRRKSVDGVEYLLIEEGGFHQKHGPDWRCRWLVFTREL